MLKSKGFKALLGGALLSICGIPLALVTGELLYLFVGAFLGFATGYCYDIIFSFLPGKSRADFKTRKVYLVLQKGVNSSKNFGRNCQNNFFYCIAASIVCVALSVLYISHYFTKTKQTIVGVTKNTVKGVYSFFWHWKSTKKAIAEALSWPDTQIALILFFVVALTGIVSTVFLYRMPLEPNDTFVNLVLSVGLGLALAAVCMVHYINKLDTIAGEAELFARYRKGKTAFVLFMLMESFWLVAWMTGCLCLVFNLYSMASIMGGLILSMLLYLFMVFVAYVSWGAIMLNNKTALLSFVAALIVALKFHEYIVVNETSMLLTCGLVLTSAVLTALVSFFVTYLSGKAIEKLKSQYKVLNKEVFEDGGQFEHLFDYYVKSVTSLSLRVARIALAFGPFWIQKLKQKI